MHGEGGFHASLKTKGEVSGDGHLRLDLPVEFPAGPVELVLVLSTTSAPDGAKYNFSDLVGQLQWKGGRCLGTEEPSREGWENSRSLDLNIGE